jgi:hypothetical protein
MSQVPPMRKSEMCLIKCHCYQFNLISDPRADNQTCGRTAIMLATTAVMLATTISKSAVFSCTYYKKFYQQKPSIKYSLMCIITFIFQEHLTLPLFLSSCLMFVLTGTTFWQFLHNSKNFFARRFKIIILITI